MKLELHDPKQLKILKSGVNEWNAWRKKSHNVRVDLKGAILHNMDLSAYDFSFADLRKTSFVGSELLNANFSNAFLEEADLSRTELSAALFINANLDFINLTEAWLTNTTFQNVDLSTAKGLTTVTHYQPSFISFSTIHRSQGKIPEEFLRGCGLSEYEINLGKLFKVGMDKDELKEITKNIVDLYGKE